MSIATYSSYASKVNSPAQHIAIGKASIAGVTGRLMSLWTVTGAAGAGATPSTAAVPAQTISGAIGQFDGATALRVPRIVVANASVCTLILCDRLSHQGGLDATATGAQTTNLPTAALTRYTDGVGVMAALEIYSAVGTTSVTATASYTDQAGNTGHTAQAIDFGNTGFREVGRFLPFSLAQGDSGVRAVASVTLSASTVSAAGNFGVTLFKPLVAIPVQAQNTPIVADGFLNLGANLPQIQNGACLFWIQICSTGVTSGHSGTMRFTED